MMPKRRTLIRLATAATLLTAPVSAQSPELVEKVERAITVLSDLLTESSPPPAELLQKASCVMVVPRLIKGAFGVGGRHGRGVLACRQEIGWSPLVFIKVSGGSIGLQIGGQSTDLVVLVVERKSIDSLLRSKFTLGADAGVAAGPRSRQVDAATDLRLDAEMYTYARSKGLFAGAAVDGARLSLDRKAISKFYGLFLRPEDILFGSPEMQLPASAVRFRQTLP